jgi:hypothetical protein
MRIDAVNWSWHSSNMLLEDMLARILIPSKAQRRPRPRVQEVLESPAQSSEGGAEQNELRLWKHASIYRQMEGGAYLRRRCCTLSPARHRYSKLRNMAIKEGVEGKQRTGYRYSGSSRYACCRVMQRHECRHVCIMSSHSSILSHSPVPFA